MADIGKFIDTSSDCAICLEPFLPDDEQHEPNQIVITLSCGHRWHQQCLVQQLQTAQPSPSHRLLFNGCQCAKCSTICEHPALTNLTRKTDILREQVDVLLKEQLALDAPETWKQAQSNPIALKSVLDHARRKYAFFLCGNCRRPYFGGTIECADEMEQDANERGQGRPMHMRDLVENRLCVACAPQSQSACQNPREHRGHLLWKCRYCCRPATHLCYRNVHFCDECHDRNSQRVLLLHRHDKNNSDMKVPPLEPIPCIGENCPYPKPVDGNSTPQTHHSNGSTLLSEQVYGCVLCQSSTSSRQNPPTLEPGSRNLLNNPSGQHGLRGWRQLNSRISWQVEQSEVPVNSHTPTNFVSSFLPCIMEQTLDLAQVLNVYEVGHQRNREANSLSSLRLEVSACYMGRTDCPSVFGLKVVILGANRRPILEKATPVYDTSPDSWERASLLFDDLFAEFPPRARYISVILIGKDSRFWRGHYGSKVTNVSVRILGEPDLLHSYLSSEIRNDRHEQRNQRRIRQGTSTGDYQGIGAPERTEPQSIVRNARRENHGGHQSDVIQTLRQGGVLSMLLFLLLAWLVQQSLG